MPAYRDPAPREPLPIETLHELGVSTTTGSEAVGCLAAIAMIFGVALAVTVFAGAPPEVEQFTWTMPIGIAVFTAIAYAVHRKRGRKVRIVKQGAARKLAVEGDAVELLFPLRLRGEQNTIHMRGVPIHYVFLQCIDAASSAVFFRETRGAIHGVHEGWLDTGLEPTRTGPSFDVGGTTHLAELRRRIEKINETMANEADAPKGISE